MRQPRWKPSEGANLTRRTVSVADLQITVMFLILLVLFEGVRSQDKVKVR